MGKLYYYVRLLNDTICIESDTTENVSSLSGFIRMAPEITSPDDVNAAFIKKLLDECDFWPIPDDTKAKFHKDAAEWIAKKG